MSLLPGNEPGATEVTMWSLQMRAAHELRPASEPAVASTLMRAQRPAPDLSRFMYQAVGAAWHWVDRAAWTPQEWLAWVDRPQHTLVTCWVDGVPAGYFELDDQAGDVELAYFGLLPGFLGLGLGGWLLTKAIEVAWSLPQTRRLWVHTCTLDAPHALANYQARGFVVFDQGTEWRRLPTQADQGGADVEDTR
ncbi:MAG: GNAT family N-acetyltransferase [Actinomycetales bacterium]|nr:GNAT family N-acetyltransferase [Actinomycetales bacterium]